MKKMALPFHPFLWLLLIWEAALADDQCALCQDGSPVTKPDFVLDLTQPFPLKTCRDLDNALSILPGASDLCSSARSLAALCGCPRDPDLNSCTICEAMTRPKQVLDGLVDLGDHDSFGLETTCELIESSVNILSKDDEACRDLPMQDLRNYCGCPGSTTGAESNECSFCPGGEILVDRFQSVAFFTSGETTVTCSELEDMASQSLKGTEACEQAQQLSTGCGCPVPSTACHLCGSGGVPLDPMKEIVFRGTRMTCFTLESLLHRLEANSSECLAIDESYKTDCRCSEEKEFVPCTVCPDGEEVPFPEKYLHGLEGLGFDYVEHTCGALDRSTRTIDESLEMCATARILGKACGCKVPEASCSICGNGIMGEPERRFSWTWGRMSEAVPEFQGADTKAIDTDSRMWTCEMADSFMSQLYEQDDYFCYYSYLLRGNGCGCPDVPEATLLIWSQRCSGMLSLVGSLFIIVSILRTQRTGRFSAFNQIILSISVFDSLSSLAFMFGTALVPQETGLQGSFGNEGTCNFQSWLFQVGITSVFYNVLLSLYFLLVVKYDWSERRLQGFLKWAHCVICGLGFGFSFAVFPFTSPNWRRCYVNRPPYVKSWLPGICLFIAPVGLSILAMTVLTVLFVMHVSTIEQKSRGKRLGDGTAGQTFTRRTIWQSTWFLSAYFVVWPIQFVTFVADISPSTYWLFVTAAILGPLQGFLNALIWKRRLIGRSMGQVLERTAHAFSTLTLPSEAAGSSWLSFRSSRFTASTSPPQRRQGGQGSKTSDEHHHDSQPSRICNHDAVPVANNGGNFLADNDIAGQTPVAADERTEQIVLRSGSGSMEDDVKPGLPPEDETVFTDEEEQTRSTDPTPTQNPQRRLLRSASSGLTESMAKLRSWTDR